MKSSEGRLDVWAAKLNWLAPAISIVIVLCLPIGELGSSFGATITLMATSVILAGIGLALWGFYLAFTVGPQKLVVPAAIGLLINGGILSIPIFRTVAPILRSQAASEAYQAVTRLEESGEWIPEGDGWYVEDREAFFAIKVPSDWQLYENPLEGVRLLARSPLSSDLDDFQESLLVVSSPIPLSSDLEACTKEQFNGLSETARGFAVYGRGTENLNGVEWTWTVYRQYNETGFEMKCAAYYTVRVGRDYLVNLVALPETYDDYEAMFLEAMESVRIPH